VPLAAGGAERICQECVTRFGFGTAGDAARCSFCNRALGRRRLLRRPLRAVGRGLEPKVAICNDCVGIAADVLAKG
jgi:hypothetical protein